VDDVLLRAALRRAPPGRARLTAAAAVDPIAPPASLDHLGVALHVVRELALLVLRHVRVRVRVRVGVGVRERVRVRVSSRCWSSGTSAKRKEARVEAATDMRPLARGCQREDAGEEVVVGEEGTVGEVEVGEAEMPIKSWLLPPVCEKRGCAEEEEPAEEDMRTLPGSASSMI